MTNPTDQPPQKAPAGPSSDQPANLATINTQAWSPDELPAFRILIAEDEDNFREIFIAGIIEFASSHYRLFFDETDNIADAKEKLLIASKGVPYDGAILDFKLRPSEGEPAVGSTKLAKYCLYQDPKPTRWVGQLTSYAGDTTMTDFWPDPDMKIDFHGGLYEKTDTDLPRLVSDMFFSEVKDPLASEWLPVELGAIESPIANGSQKRRAPADFNIYRFIRRLGTVWPRLDEETRQRASLLFEIRPGEDPVNDPPRSIGFKSFSCWDHHPANTDPST